MSKFNTKFANKPKITRKNILRQNRPEKSQLPESQRISLSIINLKNLFISINHSIFATH